MRSLGKSHLSVGTNKCKGPEAGKSAPGTISKVSKRKRDKGQNRQGLEVRMRLGFYLVQLEASAGFKLGGTTEQIFTLRK